VMQATDAQPICTIVLRAAITLLGHHPNAYLDMEICLSPVGAPKVAAKPVAAPPRIDAKMVTTILWRSAANTKQSVKLLQVRGKRYVLTQTKLMSKEARRETGRVHCARGPEEEHVELVVPWHVALVFWQFATDGFGFDACRGRGTKSAFVSRALRTARTYQVSHLIALRTGAVWRGFQFHAGRLSQRRLPCRCLSRDWLRPGLFPLTTSWVAWVVTRTQKQRWPERVGQDQSRVRPGDTWSFYSKLPHRAHSAPSRVVKSRFDAGGRVRRKTIAVCRLACVLAKN